MIENKVRDAILGVAVGDALGVPYEFRTRTNMIDNPAVDMVGFGSHRQPIGTWSDDTSLTLCLADALCDGYSLFEIARKFVAWRYSALWTAHNLVFDIGRTTDDSISDLKLLVAKGDRLSLKSLKLLANESDNGNGSLMRIMPLLFYIRGLDITKQFEIVWEVSALTHKHIRAAMSCMIYLNLAELILNGECKNDAYRKMRSQINSLWTKINFPYEEQLVFKRIISSDITDLKYDELKSGGYVIESLEASIWCFLCSSSYKDAVLKAVNLGHDTDTTAAITGGLASLYGGSESIPKKWLNQLARLGDISVLCDVLNETYMV